MEDLADKLQHMNHPVLILIRGIPGSGKSYFAGALQQALKASATGSLIVMLDPDATDYSSQEYVDFSRDRAAEGVNPKFHPYRFLRAQAHAGITSNKLIIWNQPFTDYDGFNKTIINLRAHALEHHIELPLLIVEVAINPEVAQQRVKSRKQAGGHGPSEQVFERFIRDYTSFADKGNSTVIINGEDDTATSLPAVLRAIATLL